MIDALQSGITAEIDVMPERRVRWTCHIVLGCLKELSSSKSHSIDAWGAFCRSALVVLCPWSAKKEETRPPWIDDKWFNSLP